MESEAQNSTTIPPESSSSSRNDNNDYGNFECNICFELAQDPVITLCGHLYCWPCLFRWLYLHSHSHVCPVCKALIQEEKLIPLYGRGKTPTDPRSKLIPGIEIASRPAGQRPETAPSPGAGNFSPNFLYGFLGGFIPIVIACFGNMGMSAGFGGFTIPSLVNLQVHGFSSGTVPGASPTYTDGISGAFRGNHVHSTGETSQEVQADDNLKMLLLFICLSVLCFLCFN